MIKGIDVNAHPQPVEKRQWKTVFGSSADGDILEVFLGHWGITPQVADKTTFKDQ